MTVALELQELQADAALQHDLSHMINVTNILIWLVIQK